jgi:uncharacterized membrane protein
LCKFCRTAAVGATYFKVKKENGKEQINPLGEKLLKFMDNNPKTTAILLTAFMVELIFTTGVAKEQMDRKQMMHSTGGGAVIGFLLFILALTIYRSCEGVSSSKQRQNQTPA